MAMHHELQALERQGMLEKINSLQVMLKDMESDFAECARARKSPCFFCANNDSCDYQSCNFKWIPHD